MKKHLLIGHRSKRVDEVPHSWDVDFDLALPAKGAAAVPGCGD